MVSEEMVEEMKKVLEDGVWQHEEELAVGDWVDEGGDARAGYPKGLWKSAVFQCGHFNLSVCLIFPVVGRASCA